jgi:hypothetical protein
MPTMTGLWCEVVWVSKDRQWMRRPPVLKFLEETIWAKELFSVNK